MTHPRPPCVDRLLSWLDDEMTPEEGRILMQHTRDPSVWDDPLARSVVKALFARIPPVDEDVVLWSGGEVPLNAFDFSSRERRYLTSSYALPVAEGYAVRQAEDPWLLTLVVMAGTKVIPLDHVSARGDAEAEVLLQFSCALEDEFANRYTEVIEGVTVTRVWSVVG